MKRGTPDHPKMMMLTMELEKLYASHRRKSQFGGKAEAIGILEVLWEWASKYAIRGDIGKWPNEVISKAIGWRWNPDEIISALIASKWVDEVAGHERLVIHDIQDHATNTWRQNLENAGLTWWDGSPPRKYKLQKSPNKLQKKLERPPQPEPEPEPEPERRLSKRDYVHSETPPPETPAEQPPGVRAVNQMLVDFAGHLGAPDDAVCLRLLNWAEQDVGRIEAWLWTKAARRKSIQSWGWFLEVAEAELRQFRPVLELPPERPPADNVLRFDPGADYQAVVAKLAGNKAL